MSWRRMLPVAALVLAACATVPRPEPGTVTSPIPGHPPESATPGGATARAAGGAGRTTPPSPMPGTLVGTTASGGTIRATAAAGDTVPSAEAMAVLQSIPEPLAPSQRVGAPVQGGLPANDAGSGGPTAEANATADTTGAPADSADVPVPAPTLPLGDRAGAPAKAADSLGAVAPPPASPPASAPTPPSSGPTTGRGTGAGGAAPAVPDSCWRVQVAAPPEAEKAQAMRDAAESQLLTDIVIESEKGRHKVRTKVCFTAAAAEQLRRRAIAAGFAGAFKFRGAPK